jgi:hypothetical protein
MKLLGLAIVASSLAEKFLEKMLRELEKIQARKACRPIVDPDFRIRVASL